MRGLNDYTKVTASNDMKGKILAKGKTLGLYTQNPAKGAKVSK